MGFRVQGLGVHLVGGLGLIKFRVQGLGFRVHLVWGLGLRLRTQALHPLRV